VPGRGMLNRSVRLTRCPSDAPVLLYTHHMDRDPWLDKWIPMLKQKSANGFILELGCGSGWDSQNLLSAGCKVIGADISMENLCECMQSSSHADLLQLDNSQPLPFASHSIDIILASLSLHYFTWRVTLQIASELKRCLKADGILIVRFNSTNDINYGAGYGLEIESNFSQIGTSTKRFFDEKSVRTLFQGWDIQFLEENVIHRYEKPKSVWEVMAVCG
jgi:SAM-dependent methyltransferase